MNKNDFIEVGIIEKSVNQNIKVGQLASFLFDHLCLCPLCESTLDIGLQQLLFVVKNITLS